MAPGVGLKIRDQDKDMVTVHLGPKSFVKVDSIGLKKGDRVKVKGDWAQIEGKDVFMASKVKKGENVELKVRRTKDGMPFWAMSPEELAKEKD
jgi:C-terminal processing protease CtpA/Prc